MRPHRNTVWETPSAQAVLVRVREDLRASEPAGRALDETLCTAAVVSARINSAFSEKVVNLFEVVGQDSGSILHAPSYVIDWLSQHGVFKVIGDGPDLNAVQRIEGDRNYQVLETAIVLWDPYEIESPFYAFSEALSSATRLNR